MKNLSVIVMFGFALIVIGCGAPIRSIHQTLAAEETEVQKMQVEREFEKRKQQLEEEKGRALNLSEADQLKKEKEFALGKIQAETNQKMSGYHAETNQIIKELLKKKPSEMTPEEFQTYLLIEQKHIAEQHAKNARQWQKFDVLFRTIPFVVGGGLTVILLIAD